MPVVFVQHRAQRHAQPSRAAALRKHSGGHAQLHRAIADGLPVFAECGGLMYLARTLNWNGRSAQMVGAIPGDAVMHERPVGRGYVRLQETADFPWPRDAAAPGAAVRLGHEFHHSSLENLDPSVRCAYRVQRGHGIGGGRDGVLVHNVLASYAHLRHTGGNDWPRRFMAFVRDVKRRAEAQLARLRPALTEEHAWSAR